MDRFLKVHKANFSFSVGLCVCLDVLMSEAYFGSPPYFLSQGLFWNLELTILARLAGPRMLEEQPALHNPSTDITGTCCHTY